MSKKQTYFGKNFDKLKDADHKQRIIIDPVEQKGYGEGKVILINKDLHWTSFDAVKKIRGALQIKKVGHAGTLDPLATGLLIICTGKFTKKINEYMAQEKEYTGTFTLGAVTPTYDRESEPSQEKDFSFVDADLLHETTKQFIGDIDQFPPIFSAIKKDGIALYELARRGEDVVLEARKVKISQFEIVGIELPVVHFRVVCGTGTYIRSLANDFGTALGCGAFLSDLCRTRIGEFTLDHATTVKVFLEQLKRKDE